MTIILLFTLVSGPLFLASSVSAAQAPEKPSNPYPENGAKNISVNPKLSVNVSVDDGENLTVSFYNAKNGSKIGDIYNVTDNSQDARVSISWGHLDYSTEYEWKVVVSDGNQTNTSDTWSFTTIPDIPPRIRDNTGSNPINGESFVFNSTVIDNDEVDQVRLNYTTDIWNYHKNRSMNNSVEDYYIESIQEVAPSASILNYSVLAQDINGNWNSTEIRSLNITDNDRPDIYIDPDVLDSQTLYGSVNITAEITDNRDIGSVIINMTNPDGSSFEESMGSLGNTWYFKRTYSSTGRYDYRITAEDESGNIERSELKSLLISDKTKPEIDDRSKPKTYTGKSYEFKCIVTDNYKVSEVYVEYWFGRNEYSSINNSLTNSMGNTWVDSVDIPTDDDKPLKYVISAVDKSGNWNTTEIREIEVIDDIPPVPKPGGNRDVNIGDVVTFDGSESHDNIEVVKYQWIIEGVTINGKTINYIFGDVKFYEVTLVVWDECGNKGQKTIIVNVVDDKKPVADAGSNLKIDEGTEVILDGSGSYDEVEIDNYTWIVDNETRLYGVTPNYTFEDPGTYFVELNVTDTAGNYDKDIAAIWVNDLTDPVAQAGKNWTIYTDQRVRLNAKDSYDNYKIASYEWHIDNEVYYGEKILHVFSDVGDYKVTLKVIDEAGNFDTDTIYVTVKDGEEPTAEAGQDSVVVVDEKVMLDGSYSSDNVGIKNYTWTIVEKNEVLYGENPTYEFEESGTYTVRLTVRDYNNNVGQDAIKVEVEKKEKPLSLLNILLPIIVFISAVAGLILFFWMGKPEKEPEKEEKEGSKEEEEETSEEESSTDISKEEIIQKLKSGELTPKQLEDLMVESQKEMSKNIAEVYQYLEVLRSKAQEYREGKGEEGKTEKQGVEQDTEEKTEEEQESEEEPSPETQQPPEPQEAPPGLDELSDEDEEQMENMMNQLNEMDDSEAPEGFPSPDEGEEPPSLDDATETGDISQDDIDDLFH